MTSEQSWGLHALSQAAGARDLTALGDGAQLGALEMPKLWADLLTGQASIVDAFFSAERSYLVLSTDQRAPLLPPPESRFRLLERFLAGTSHKAAAIDGGLACSTVAFACRQCLTFMGLSCLPSKAPPLLFLLAHSAQGSRSTIPVWAREFEQSGSLRRIVAAPRFESRFAQLLSPAAYQVMRLLVEGKTHAEIAATRGTAERTIANQLATVFTSIRVSGRSGLINHLIRHGDVSTDWQSAGADSPSADRHAYSAVATS
jgi:DNA-binding NarL/FixJ family response regulator